jgi:flagellar biosynthesis protein FlhG
VVNRAHSYREAVETSRALKNACSSFLKIKLKTLGFLMEDVHVGKAVRSQTPFFISFPNCEAARSIKQIVYAYLPDRGEDAAVKTKGIRGFFEKMLSFGKSS